MRLYRPHVPIAVRCEVAARQLGWKHEDFSSNTTFRDLLAHRLVMLGCLLHCAAADLHLDHDPPLAARMKRTMPDGRTICSPDANDPAHLIYREKHAHQIKTNVRGEHGQYPDRVLIKRERRRQRKPRTKLKRKWAKRPMPKVSRPWPKREMR